MTDINIYKTGSDLLNFIAKRWWIIVSATIIGIALGNYKTPTSLAPYYETQLTGEAIDISNVAVAKIINTLATSANSHNAKQLAYQLNLDEELTVDIKGLRAKPFINYDPVDNLNNKIFTVIIVTSNFNVLPPFIDKLETYVNNDPLFKNKGQIKISPKFNIPKRPAITSPKTLMIKYGVLFFLLGIFSAILISFIANIRKYQNSTK